MRKTILTLLALLALGLFAATAQAQSFGYGSGDGVCNFVDEDGDGFNDLAPDADGDGIPNGQDPDYVPAGDGTGAMHQWGRNHDVDGPVKMLGFTYAKSGEFSGNGHRYGPGDGTGSGTGPADGTGFGPGDGTGDCDGTGDTSKGVVGRRGGRR